MRIEQIKLSPKKGGNGYISSFSVSIGIKEATLCNLVGKRIIKIVDERKKKIVIKRKEFTVTTKIVEKVIKLNKMAFEEECIKEMCDKESHNVFSSSSIAEKWINEIKNERYRKHEDVFMKYLLSLPEETLADLVLLMYMGRERDADLNIDEGETRFLDFFDTYAYIVCGATKEELAETLNEKSPLEKYLRTGMSLVWAPKGSSLETICSY